MADTIQIKAGNKGNMPVLADREIAYVRDEKALHIGTPQGNVKLCDAYLEDTVSKKLTADKVAAQAALAAEADLPTVISGINNLIAAMKSSGVMNT